MSAAGVAADGLTDRDGHAHVRRQQRRQVQRQQQWQAAAMAAAGVAAVAAMVAKARSAGVGQLQQRQQWPPLGVLYQVAAAAVVGVVCS
jgi:hypothetical protein